MQAVGLPVPVRELRFDTGCCGHPDGCHPILGRLAGRCRACGYEKVCDPVHGPRRWRFDFAWPDRKIAAEVEGGTESGGRHVRPGGFDKDAEKYNAAAQQGWTVYRFTRRMVTSGEALNVIEKALREPVTAEAGGD